VNIDGTGGDGIKAANTDLNVTGFSISNTGGNGISFDGRGNAVIAHGRITNPKGHGIAIGDPSPREVMEVLARIINDQDDDALKQMLVSENEKFKQANKVEERKAILRQIVEVLIQRGLGTAVEEAIRNLGGNFHF
jgi:hypothetical protein